MKSINLLKMKNNPFGESDYWCISDCDALPGTMARSLCGTQGRLLKVSAVYERDMKALRLCHICRERYLAQRENERKASERRKSTERRESTERRKSTDGNNDEDCRHGNPYERPSVKSICRLLGVRDRPPLDDSGEWSSGTKEVARYNRPTISRIRRI